MADNNEIWLATCQKEQLRRLQDLSMHHARERIALELAIEVKPLESSFSPQLLELMAKEEAAQQNARGSPEMLQQIAARVDERLCSETRRYFTQQGEHNQKRWVALFSKQAGERSRLSAEIMQHLSAMCESLGLSPPAFLLAGGKGSAGVAVPETEDVDEFDEEERALRKHAHDCLADNEHFNLNHAFGLQFARVDSEWSSYEVQMKFEYETQRAALEGKRQQTIVMTGAAQQQQGPWKNKEKQSRMIHTAPVFTPDGAMPKIPVKGGRNPTRAGAGAAPNASSRAVEKEMQALEQAYMQAQARIAHQKSNATRWIQRQSNRMQIQLEAVNQDRVVCSRYLDRECDELKSMESKIERFVRWMASQQQHAPPGAAAAVHEPEMAPRPASTSGTPRARQRPLPALHHSGN